MNHLDNSTVILTTLLFCGLSLDLWEGLIQPHIPLWADEYDGINVVAGPIFDYDSDGIRDHANTTDKDG